MRTINRVYINGEFVKPYGTEVQELINPSTREIIGRVTLGNEEDAKRAIAAAKKPLRLSHELQWKSADKYCKDYMTQL